MNLFENVLSNKYTYKILRIIAEFILKVEVIQQGGTTKSMNKLEKRRKVSIYRRSDFSVTNNKLKKKV